MASMRTYKGQYFSMDAIVASVIFVLALSLLMSHFFSLRAQNDSRSSYLIDDAYRISGILLGPGDPSRWYEDPNHANTSGFGWNGSRDGALNLSALQAASFYLNPSWNGLKYNASRALFVTSAEYYVVINTSIMNHPDQGLLIQLGREPLPGLNPKEVVSVRRGVMIVDSTVTPPDYHYGTMTLTLWMNRSRI